MAAGADGAADALTKRYAKASAAGPAGIHRVVFTGIDGSEDFIRLSGYLQVDLGGAPDHAGASATPDSLEVDLDLLTGLSGLRRVLDKDVLAEAEGNIEGVPPVFVLH